MNVLVVGGGAREHVLVWKILQSSKVDKVYVAPGNAGTAQIAHNLDVSPTDFDTLAKESRSRLIDLIVVGPEAPLAAGIVDYFQQIDIPVFGSTQSATLIESSKVFAKNLMLKYDIPCAKSETFNGIEEAQYYVKSQQPPLVIKADGLAAGKGVIIANTVQEALDALVTIMVKREFGESGNQVLIEEYLSGREVSLLCFTDGKTAVPMVPACDYKRVYDNDLGLNTGGMGAYSPPNFFNDKLVTEVTDTIIKPVINAMGAEGKIYKGVLYTGLMMTDNGPKVLEFNARFGDPETQVILPRLKTDLVDIILSVINGTLHEQDIEWSNDACVGVVMASGGYPGTYKTGYPIKGLDKLDSDIMVFHAGTKFEQGEICTSGGRVLTVTSMGETLFDAMTKVYLNLPRIRFDNEHYRKDIALRETL